MAVRRSPSMMSESNDSGRTSHLATPRALALTEPTRWLTVLAIRRRISLTRLMEDQRPGYGHYWWAPFPPSRFLREQRPSWMVLPFHYDDWPGMSRAELWPLVLRELELRWHVPSLADYLDHHRALPSGRVGLSHRAGRSLVTLFQALGPRGRSNRAVRRAFNLPERVRVEADPTEGTDQEAQWLLRAALTEGRRGTLHVDARATRGRIQPFRRQAAG